MQFTNLNTHLNLVKRFYFASTFFLEKCKNSKTQYKIKNRCVNLTYCAAFIIYMLLFWQASQGTKAFFYANYGWLQKSYQLTKFYFTHHLNMPRHGYFLLKVFYDTSALWLVVTLDSNQYCGQCSHWTRKNEATQYTHYNLVWKSPCVTLP